MYGLAVNLIVSVSGHPWIINEIAGVTKPHAIITNFFLSLCLFLSVCFYAVKGISLEPT